MMESNKYLRRYQKNNLIKVMRISTWSAMTLDWVSGYFGITKSELLRALILSVQSNEEIHKPFNFPIAFFNETKLINIRLNQEDLFFLEETSSHLKFSMGQLIDSILITCLDKEIGRLKENKPRARTLNANKIRQYYFSSELVDALFHVRDERGESPSLLLQEAVLQNRNNSIEGLPIHRKEHKLTLTLSSQEWEMVDMLAASSSLAADETAASLLINHYFESSHA